MIFDAWGFLSAAPHWLVYLVALIGLMLGAWWITRLSYQMNRLISCVDIINDVKQSVDNHIRETDKHFKDSDKIASEEHWKNCSVSKCVHVQQFTHALNKVNERFDQFDRRADETRSNTVTSLEGLRDGQRDLAREIGKELSDLAKQLISVLAENIRRK